MQQRRTARSGRVLWVVGVLAIVLVAAAGLVGARFLTDDDGATAATPSGSASATPGEPTDSTSSSSGATPDVTPVGAGALGPKPELTTAGVQADRVEGAIVPDPAEGDDDLPDLYADECQLSVEESAIKSCIYGVPESQAKATVALVGDSKAAQWLPALQILADRYQWRLEVYTKSACSPSTAPMSNAGQVYRTCSEFNRQVRRQLTENPVDLVFTGSGRASAVTGRNRSGSLRVSPERLAEGLRRTWQVWAAAGMKVLVVSDNPKPVDPADDRDIFDVPKCVEEHPDELTACTFDRDKGVELGGFRTQDLAFAEIGARNLTRALRDSSVEPRHSPDISYVNIIPWVCPTDVCPAVIGNVLIYRNGSHLTKTYVETLTPLIEKALIVIGSEPRPRRVPMPR